MLSGQIKASSSSDPHTKFLSVIEKKNLNLMSVLNKLHFSFFIFHKSVALVLPHGPYV